MLTLVLVSQIALNYGQTSANIDAMGRDGWVKFCEKKVGRDLYEYELRAHIYQYAEAVRITNQTRMAKAPASVRPYYTILATELPTFATELVLAEQALAGGGTMHLLFFANASASAADAVKAVITNKFKARKPHVVSDVTTGLNTFDVAVRNADPDFAKPADAQASIAKARASFGKITQALAKRPRAESDYVLEFCLDSAELQTLGN